ncbi:MAG: hypothetical protein RLZZ427_351 [Pseudomonadota bacterium]|jgi:hypothetical protein
MTSPQTGGCLCGAVRYSVAAEPLMQVICHCKNCQRQSGSAWSMIAGVPETAVTITGALTTYEDHGDSGGGVLRQFCGTCGSPLFSRVASAPGMLFIKAGTLDDTSAFAPAVQIWTKSRQHWIEQAGDMVTVPAFAANPG